MNEDPGQIIELLAAHDDGAAQRVFDQYVNRLISLARSRLSSRIKRRVDPEDVVQSAFRSFFRRAGEQAFELADSGDLWRLLVVITLNKLRRRVEHHQAAKRSVSREAQPVLSDDGSAIEFDGKFDTPEAAVELQDELTHLTQSFDETQRRMIELRLQGYQLEEIADDVGKSERTVRRTMDRLKSVLNERMDELN